MTTWLSKARAVCDRVALSSGAKWTHKTGTRFLSWRILDERDVEIALCCDVYADDVPAFIAASRTLFPEAIERIERLNRALAELLARRAADLTAAEVEALKWLIADTNIDTSAHQSELAKAYMDKREAALAVLSRLIEAQEPK